MANYRIVRYAKSGKTIVLLPDEVKEYGHAGLIETSLINALIREAGLDKTHPKIHVAAEKIRLAGKAIMTATGAALMTCSPADLEFLDDVPTRKQERKGVLWFSILLPAGMHQRHGREKNVIRNW